MYKIVDLPANFLYEYQDGLEAVEAPAVLAAVRRHVQPEELVVVVCGSRGEMLP